MSNTTSDISLVDANYMYRGTSRSLFSMIDNYIYFYHTDTLIALPSYPESIADHMAIQYNPTSPLSSTAPTYSFQSAGPRSFDISIPLHRDLMSNINITNSILTKRIPNLTTQIDVPKEGTDETETLTVSNSDYVDILIKQLYGAALPEFNASEKAVNPPVIAVRFGNDIFCKGVVSSGITVTYGVPILEGNRYANVTVAFTINEITPYDASMAMRLGGYRGFDLSNILS